MNATPPAKAERSEPVIDIAVEPKTKGDHEKMVMALARLAAEDPSFSVKTDEESGQTIICGTSELHLDIIVDRLRGEFDVGANVGTPQVAYRETITRTVEHEYAHKPSGGSGQLTRIKFRMEPNGAGSGFEFASSGPAALLPKQNTTDVRRGVETVMGSGPLIGFPIINLKFVLIDVHYDESSSPVIKIASRAGFREAMAKAGPKILEPVMSVEVVTPGNYVSDIVGDLNSRRGRIRGTEVRGLISTVRAMVPLSNMFGYVNSLRTLTNGRAQHSMTFDHYEPVPAFPGNDGPFGAALAMRA